MEGGEREEEWENEHYISYFGVLISSLHICVDPIFKMKCIKNIWTFRNSNPKCFILFYNSSYSACKENV